MSEVYRALADPTRRRLLDALFVDDGQTLGALEERFAMSEAAHQDSPGETP